MALLFVLSAVLVLVVPPLIRFLRNYDRAMRRALEKANAGDRDGAMSDIHAEINSRGPSGPRANALGVVHMLRQEWNEALLRFREAEQLGFDRQVSRMNQALAMHHAGDSEGALPILEEQFARNPYDILVGCNLSSVLVALGRRDEARTTIAEVERRRKNNRYIGPGAAEAVDRLIHECRAAVEGKPKEGLPELEEL
jgi:Flp pilus assembly protein TadD